MPFDGDVVICATAGYSSGVRVVTRESYFDTGLDVLSDLEYGGLKLAEVHVVQEVFAAWALYLLVVYEQAALPVCDDNDLKWILDQLLHALDSGRFARCPTTADNADQPVYHPVHADPGWPVAPGGGSDQGARSRT